MPLPQVAKLESGHTPSRKNSSYWENGDVPWLSLKDIRGLESRYIYTTADCPTMLGIDNSSARILPKGTVAFCRTASVGEVVILGRDMATSQDFVNWVCGRDVDPEYLYWAFRCSGAEFDKEKQGSTHKTIYMPVAERFMVLLPPLAEQRRIAAILDAAEALRAKRRAALAKLDTLTQSIFIEMFGDPRTNPNNWEQMSLGDLVEEFRYGTSNKSSDTGLPALRIPNVVGGAIDLTDLKTVPVEPAERDRLLLQNGDVLFVRTNGNPDYVGRCAVFRPTICDQAGFDGNAFIYASYLIRARLKPDLVAPEYLREFMIGHEGRRQLRAKCKTSAGQFNLNTESLGAITLQLPPMSMQQEYCRRLNFVNGLKLAQHRASVGLDRLFSSLQHRAFRGEL